LRLAVLSATAAWAVLFGHQARAGYGIEFGPSVALGDTLGGTFAQAYDWSVYAGTDWEFGVVMSLQGTDPELPFTVEFFDSNFVSSFRYRGNTMGTLPSNTFLPLTLTLTGTPTIDYSTVAGMQFTWDGEATISTYLTYAAARNINTTSVVNLTPLWSGSYNVDPGSTTATYTQTPPPPPPTTGGSFTARAPGGVRFLTSTNATGVQLVQGATDWASLSDRNAKTDITPIDHRETLRKVDGLPVTTWNYKHDADRTYIGPMAQDFHSTFGLGHDDKHISTLDTDGVTLSALKGLIEELRERQERSAAQARRLAELEAELRTLSEKLISNLPPAP
jgi:hypothetical protein